MRGRVFSAFYVMRDVIFLFGMAGAGLADIIDIRLLIIFASSLLFVSAGVHARRARARRLDVAAPRRLACAVRRRRRRSPRPPVRPATLADFDRLAARLGAFARLSPEQRSRVRPERATVREVPGGTRIVEHGDVASSAYFILDGSTTAGIPTEDGYRGLSTMAAGDFFGEIAALTGSPRTADVVADVDTTLLEVPADALRATMDVPEISATLVLPTLTEPAAADRAADLPRLAGIDQDDLRDLRTPRPSVEAAALTV